MGDFLDRFRRRAAPTDSETAAYMLELAEVFQNGMAAAGTPFGWGSGEATRLDGACDTVLAAGPSAEVLHSTVMNMGAYLGELLVRHGGGRWVFDVPAGAAVVELPNGLRAFPHNKVAKRLSPEGGAHHLFTFYWYGLTGEVPPGAEATESLGDGSVGDGSVGDGSVGDGSVGDGSVGDGSVGDGSLAEEPPAEHG
ncbi:hypothetical protein [Actinoplanes sp. NPDC051851]|uniref:hypothetical protein n=1 Tax=Actinoplanes sp. NPDC051851 TaxID=3154753 RepID=UPI0034246634